MISTDYGLQMPNRPLRRGENLLEIWDKSSTTVSSKARQQQLLGGKNTNSKGSRKSAAIDIAALIGPQKLSQWFT